MPQNTEFFSSFRRMRSIWGRESNNRNLRDWGLILLPSSAVSRIVKWGSGYQKHEKPRNREDVLNILEVRRKIITGLYQMQPELPCSEYCLAMTYLFLCTVQGVCRVPKGLADINWFSLNIYRLEVAEEWIVNIRRRLNLAWLFSLMVLFLVFINIGGGGFVPALQN